MADNAPAGESADKLLGSAAPESVSAPAPIPESVSAPTPTRGVPLITFDMSEETDSKWEKIINFFKSTIGKIFIFTTLFLGIAFYILTTSNAVLFQGKISGSEGLISRSQLDTAGAVLPTGTATIDTSKILDQNLVIGNTQNDLIANSNTIDPNMTLNDPGMPGVINTVDDGAAAPIIYPAAPTALTKVCAADGKSVTLRWLPPVYFTPLTYDLRVDNLKNGWAKENSPLPTNPGDIVDNDLTAGVYMADIDPNQEYKWWVHATGENDLVGEDAMGVNFSCPGNAPAFNFINPAINTDLFAGLLTPAAPENLKATCEPSSKWVELSWTSGNSSTTDTYKVSVFDQSATSDVLPKSGTTGLMTYQYSNPKPNQLYTWRVNAVGTNGKLSDQKTSEFTCAGTAVVTPFVPPSQLGGTTVCPDNKYFVTDSNPAKSACKNIPAYQGAAVQSDFICELYTKIAGDAVAYKINNVTMETLQKRITSQCKDAVQPKKDPIPTVCPTGAFLNGSTIPADCKAVPIISGLTGDALWLMCGQLKTLYEVGPAIKMSNQTMDDILKTVNGQTCLNAKAPAETTKLCPANTFPFGSSIPADCQKLPGIDLLKSQTDISNICKIYKNILVVGKDKKMNVDTVKGMKEQISKPYCDSKLYPDNGNTEDGSGEVKSSEEKVSGGKKTKSKELQVLENQATGNVTPSHPVAGKQKPHGTASTGPEMWIYGIGVVMSYYGARRKKSRK